MVHLWGFFFSFLMSNYGGPLICILNNKVHVFGRKLFLPFPDKHTHIWMGKDTFLYQFLQLLVHWMSSHDDIAFCSKTKICTHDTSYIYFSLAYWLYNMKTFHSKCGGYALYKTRVQDLWNSGKKKMEMGVRRPILLESAFIHFCFFKERSSEGVLHLHKCKSRVFWEKQCNYF